MKKYITTEDFKQNQEIYSIFTKAKAGCKTEKERELLSNFMTDVLRNHGKIAEDIYLEVMQKRIFSDSEKHCFLKLVDKDLSWNEVEGEKNYYYQLFEQQAGKVKALTIETFRLKSQKMELKKEYEATQKKLEEQLHLSEVKREELEDEIGKLRERLLHLKIEVVSEEQVESVVKEQLENIERVEKIEEVEKQYMNLGENSGDILDAAFLSENPDMGILMESLVFEPENEQEIYEELDVYEPADGEVEYHPLSEEELPEDKENPEEKEKENRVGFFNALFLGHKLKKFRGLSKGEQLNQIMELMETKEEYQEKGKRILVMTKLAKMEDLSGVYANLLDNQPIFEEVENG